MYYNGLYHLFYQYSPREPIWDNIVWGHSVSKDLVNWEALEPAIYPSEWFDTNGCWSGSATIVPVNKPVILYTGIDTKHRQVQVYATPKDLCDLYLREWVKPKGINPVITADISMNANAFRDPTTGWYADGHWNILVGSELKDGGVVYLYRSKDFKKWIKAEHPFHSKMETGMWECPDFFPVLLSGQTGLDLSDDSKNVKYVLKVSLDLARYDYYTVGSYDRENDRYYPDDNSVDGWDGLRLDYGNFYASRTFYDPIKKRRIVWAWVTESALDQQQRCREKGWAGIQIFPRKVWLDESGKQLVQWPIEEVEGLRGQTVQLANHQINKGEHVEIIGVTAAQADIDVIFSFQSLENVELFDPKWENLAAQDVCASKSSRAQGGIGPFGLLTLASQNLEEFTAVFFIVFKASGNYKVLLCSDARSSSLASGLKKPSFAGFVDIDLADREISLRSLIDHSVVESFGAGGKIVVTSRVYPTIAVYDKTHLFAFNNGSETIKIENLNAWSLGSPIMNRPVKDSELRTSLCWTIRYFYDDFCFDEL